MSETVSTTNLIKPTSFYKNTLFKADNIQVDIKNIKKIIEDPIYSSTNTYRLKINKDSTYYILPNSIQLQFNASVAGFSRGTTAATDHYVIFQPLMLFQQIEVYLNGTEIYNIRNNRQDISLYVHKILTKSQDERLYDNEYIFISNDIQLDGAAITKYACNENREAYFIVIPHGQAAFNIDWVLKLDTSIFDISDKFLPPETELEIRIIFKSNLHQWAFHMTDRGANAGTCTGFTVNNVRLLYEILEPYEALDAWLLDKWQNKPIPYDIINLRCEIKSGLPASGQKFNNVYQEDKMPDKVIAFLISNDDYTTGLQNKYNFLGYADGTHYISKISLFVNGSNFLGSDKTISLNPNALSNTSIYRMLLDEAFPNNSINWRMWQNNTIFAFDLSKLDAYNEETKTRIDIEITGAGLSNYTLYILFYVRQQITIEKDGRITIY